MKSRYVLALVSAVIVFGCNSRDTHSTQTTVNHDTTRAVSADLALSDYPLEYSLPINEGKVRLHLVDISVPEGQRANIIVDLTDRELQGFQGESPNQPFEVTRSSGTISCVPDAVTIASGKCKVAIDGDFSAYLRRREIDMPNTNFLAGLIATDVTSATIDALCAIMGTCPSMQQLVVTLGAGVDESYVSRWAGESVSPDSYDDLMMFKSLGVTPEYVRELSNAGVSDLNSKNVIQLKMFHATEEKVRTLALGNTISTQQVMFSLVGEYRDN